jgi:hypothetical protein
MYLTFVEAVILILKHATFLRLSNLSSAKSALTLAELDYQEANVDSTIQNFMASSHEHSVEQFTAFIMATDIGSFILSSVHILSH